MADQHPVGEEAPGGRVHPGHRQRLFGSEGGQQPGQALGQHGLARSGRAHHQQVVASGRRHFEGVAPEGLSPHIGQVGPVRRRSGRRRGRDGGPLAPGPQDLRQFGQRRHPVYRVAPDQEGLPGVAEGHDQLEGCRGVGQGDHARDMTQGAVQPQLATERQRLGAGRWKLARGHQHPHGDRQVEPGTPLPDA